MMKPPTIAVLARLPDDETPYYSSASFLPGCQVSGCVLPALEARERIEISLHSHHHLLITIQCSAVQCSAVQCSAVQCSKVEFVAVISGTGGPVVGLLLTLTQEWHEGGGGYNIPAIDRSGLIV